MKRFQQSMFSADIAFEIEGHGLKLVETMSRVENIVLADAAKMNVPKKNHRFLCEVGK